MACKNESFKIPDDRLVAKVDDELGSESVKGLADGRDSVRCVNYGKAKRDKTPIIDNLLGPADEDDGQDIIF